MKVNKFKATQAELEFKVSPKGNNTVYRKLQTINKFGFPTVSGNAKTAEYIGWFPKLDDKSMKALKKFKSLEFEYVDDDESLRQLILVKAS